MFGRNGLIAASKFASVGDWLLEQAAGAAATKNVKMNFFFSTLG